MYFLNETFLQGPLMRISWTKHFFKGHRSLILNEMRIVFKGYRSLILSENETFLQGP